jgi:hypothetical protein
LKKVLGLSEEFSAIYSVTKNEQLSDMFVGSKTYYIAVYIIPNSHEMTHSNPRRPEKYDLLGLWLAILTGVADQSQAEQIMAHYPHSEVGPPVICPQQPFIKIYHNRAIWPFVTAYSLRAAKLAHNDSVVTHNVMSLINGAAMNLSNMENFEFTTLSNYHADGDYSGPEINSQRQLWSVAGYMSMVLDIVFGLETSDSGIRFKPFITKDLRTNL